MKSATISIKKLRKTGSKLNPSWVIPLPKTYTKTMFNPEKPFSLIITQEDEHNAS